MSSVLMTVALCGWMGVWSGVWFAQPAENDAPLSMTTLCGIPHSSRRDITRNIKLVRIKGIS